MPSTKLATILRQADLITLAQQQEVIKQVGQSQRTVPSVLIANEMLDSSELATRLEKIFGLKLVNIDDYPFETLQRQLGLKELIQSHCALPLRIANNRLYLGLADPTNIEALDEFRFATGLQTQTLLVEQLQLEEAITKLFGRSGPIETPEIAEVSDSELSAIAVADEQNITNTGTSDISGDDAPVTRFINRILIDAINKGVSDIHFEPYEKVYRVRYRLDGILVETASPPTSLSQRISTRIKVMSRLDISERRKPQDGRIKLKISENTSIDMRVSTLPTLWGEKVVLRLLSNDDASLDINMLGYSEEQKNDYLQSLKQPQGMILITGPTGSGKTVSLYTGLNILNTPERNIATAEDPVEINLVGVNQVQINPKAGLGFAEALKSFLRQDPDIVMVGEIRDFETAEIAIKAAQTGHLVLSTLHTNSAAETLTRLANMGVAGFNIASSMSLIIAQRLARRLCKHCKQPAKLTPTQMVQLGFTPEESRNGADIYQQNEDGCDKCSKGYKGRTGVYEVMKFSPLLARAVIENRSSDVIEKVAMKEGMRTLRQSGLSLILQGITSVQEIERVIR
ncbi:Type II secretion system protein E [Vibrio stylophorae]|uniref:Type II secretion system protein E n=1 Tax=Vibrio stylophorae TaxID=659351 RepID=A0ABM8ZWQ1_9VIBR|nr:type IV-A pilus assembly ATPase PilB [Vibrio stylophorae]CAH0534435.1 Type II secretion system protein E [Vibrio stylophorae]